MIRKIIYLSLLICLTFSIKGWGQEFDETSKTVILKTNETATVPFILKHSNPIRASYSIRVTGNNNSDFFINVSPTSFSLENFTDEIEIKAVVRNPGLREGATSFVLFELEKRTRFETTFFSFSVNIRGAIEIKDSDRDGIPDSEDRCPTVSGPSSNNGCPIATCSLSAPSNRNTTNITPNSAMLSWDTVSNASSYNVQYKKSINSSWISNTTSNSNRTVSNLESNTVYNWRVRSRCSNGAFSSWSVTNNFTTLHGCQNELVITQNVNANQTDNQSAQNSITVTNTVNNGAIANYDAGTSVFLKPGFKTNAGAKFKAFIEGCSVVANKVSVNQEKRVLEDETLSTEENSTINNKAFIKLYPNPTKDIFKIESNSTIVKYTVLNQLSKVVINKAVNKSIINVNIQNLTSGIYFVRITLQNGKIITKKIIKK